MTISVHNIGTIKSKPGTTMAFTIPAGGVPAGSLIFVGFFGAGYIGTVNDTVGNQYYDIFGNTSSLYAWNSIALNNGDHITLTIPNQQSCAATAFYATGIQSVVNPIEYDQCTLAGGFNEVSITSGAPTTPGSLIVAVLGTKGPSGDSFTQSPGWSAPPNRIGTTGQNVSTNSTVAGGYIISDVAVTYAPIITKRTWLAALSVFAPAV